MFCPKCGVKNLEDVKFCRACGANVSLVPQALAGSLAAEPEGKGKKVSKPEEPPTLEKGFESIFGAIAFFLIVGLGYYYFIGLFLVWIWFIIPALERLGKGIGQLIRAGRAPHALAAPHAPVEPHAARALHDGDPALLKGAATAEIVPPGVTPTVTPSVTEETTRSLGAAAPRTPRNAH